MSDIAKRLSAAVTAFGKIGTSNGSAAPVTGSNIAPIAYELLIAQRLAKIAKDRKDRAMAAAREAGILADEYKPGDYTPYAADGLAVTVKRNNDSLTLDKVKLKNKLMVDHKMDDATATKLIVQSSKPRKGNTIVTVGVM